MSITLTGTGGLFTRLGRLAAAINNINGFLGTTAINTTATWGSGGQNIEHLRKDFDDIEAQYQSARQELVDGLYRILDSSRSVLSGSKSSLQQIALQTLIAMVDDDADLTELTTFAAMKELIRQMTGAASVEASTISVGSITAGSGNNGDGSVAASILGPNGVQMEYVFPENLDVLCTQDSQAGNQTEGQELFSVRGDAAQSDPLAHDWPRGSGTSISLSAVSGAEDGGSGVGANMLTNGDMEDFTANVPDSWAVTGGVAGTDIFQETSNFYDGAKALKFTGTGGGPNSAVELTLSTTQFEPLGVYAVNCWMKKEATATGTISLALIDGSSTIIADEAATDNNVTQVIASLSSSAWTAVKGFFRMPAVLPSTIKFRIRASTALLDTKSVYMDRFALTKAQQIYTGGPFMAIFSGVTKFIVDDSFVAPINNNYGSAWQKAMERLFGMRSLGLQLPVDASPTIADSLILG